MDREIYGSAWSIYNRQKFYEYITQFSRKQIKMLFFTPSVGRTWALFALFSTTRSVGDWCTSAEKSSQVFLCSHGSLCTWAQSHGSPCQTWPMPHGTDQLLVSSAFSCGTNSSSSSSSQIRLCRVFFPRAWGRNGERMGEWPCGFDLKRTQDNPCASDSPKSRVSRHTLVSWLSWTSMPPTKQLQTSGLWPGTALAQMRVIRAEQRAVPVTDKAAWRIAGGLSKVSARLQAHAGWSRCGGKRRDGSEAGRKGGREAGPAAPGAAPRCATAPPRGSGRSAPRLAAPNPARLRAKGRGHSSFKYRGGWFAWHQDGWPCDWPVPEQPPLPAPVPTEGAGQSERGAETRALFA